MRRAWLVIISLAGVAHADPAKDLATAVVGATGAPAGTKPPRIALNTTGRADVAPMPFPPIDMPSEQATLTNVVVGKTADGKAAWIAADAKVEMICVAIGCPAHDPHPRLEHVLIAADVAAPWQPVAVHVGLVGKDSDAAKNGPPPKLDDSDDADNLQLAIPPMLSSAKLLADAVSNRRDVVLYGSGPGERYVGGAAVKATILKWNLALAARDGVRVGETANHQLGWAVFSVDAKSGSKTTPYRVLLVFERTATVWQLVAGEFSLFYPES